MATKDETSVSLAARLPVNSTVWRALKNPKIAIGLGILVPIVIVSLLGDLVTPYDPLANHLADRYAAPSGEYLLGTDHLGRDLLSRIIVGGRTSLLLGFGATTISLLGGVPIGLLAGYSGGRIDEWLMRIMDIIMSVPTLLLGLLILVALPSSIINVIFAIGLVFIPRIARVTRSATLAEREESYILAAQARGESSSHILFREILPNVTAPIAVEGSIRVGYAIMIGTSLSFLGLGSGPPYPDWGFMISVAREHLYQTPWYILWPSLALLLTIMATNLLGDGLRDVLDPKTTDQRR